MANPVPVWHFSPLPTHFGFATMKRSTNGGGENSPVLTCEDDAYELFFAGLETDN